MRGNVAKRLAASFVGEVDVYKPHVALHGATQARKAPYLRPSFVLGLENLVQAFARCARRLQHLVEPAQAGDRFVEQRQVEDEGDAFADCKSPCYDHRAAHPKHHCRADRGGEIHPRRVDRPEAHHCERPLAQQAREAMEPLALIAFLSERFGLPYAHDAIGDERGDRRRGAALLAKQHVRRAGVSTDPSNKEQQRRHRAQSKDGTLRRENRRDGDQRQQRSGAELAAIDDHSLDKGYVVDEELRHLRKSE